jgi:hypothetical protein
MKPSLPSTESRGSGNYSYIGRLWRLDGRRAVNRCNTVWRSVLSRCAARWFICEYSLLTQ